MSIEEVVEDDEWCTCQPDRTVGGCPTHDPFISENDDPGSENDDPKLCTICLGTKVYINAYGRISDQPCNICDPEGWEKLLAEKRRTHSR